MSLREIAHNLNERFIIAIDGTSASGKGTLCKKLAQNLSMKHYASSIFYRKLARALLDKNTNENNLDQIIEVARSMDYNAPSQGDIYGDEVTQLTSKIAAIPEVRHILYKPQRDLIENTKRIVIDGRDIGTVIAPDAHLKIFINASLQERAIRRFEQLKSDGHSNVSLEEIIASLKERDERDSTRKDSPLKIHMDALVIDATKESPEEIFNEVMDHINKH